MAIYLDTDRDDRSHVHRCADCGVLWRCAAPGCQPYQTEQCLPCQHRQADEWFAAQQQTRQTPQGEWS